MEGDVMHLPASVVSLPQLQRIRRQFLSLNRQHRVSKTRIRAAFIEHLEENLN